jgi:hypothetical protein
MNNYEMNLVRLAARPGNARVHSKIIMSGAGGDR